MSQRPWLVHEGAYVLERWALDGPASLARQLDRSAEEVAERRTHLEALAQPLPLRFTDAYLAALWDSAGTVTTIHRGRKSQPTPHLALSDMDGDLVCAVARSLGVGAIDCRREGTIWAWRCDRIEDCRQIAQRMLHHSRMRRRPWEIVAQWPPPQAWALSPEQVAERVALRDELRDLLRIPQRGRSPR